MIVYSHKNTIYSLENVRKVSIESYWLNQKENFRVIIFYTDGTNEKIECCTEGDAITTLRVIRTLLREG